MATLYTLALPSSDLEKTLAFYKGLGIGEINLKTIEKSQKKWQLCNLGRDPSICFFEVSKLPEIYTELPVGKATGSSLACFNVSD